jgi:hypothetical protein
VDFQLLPIALGRDRPSLMKTDSALNKWCMLTVSREAGRGDSEIGFSSQGALAMPRQTRMP